MFATKSFTAATRRTNRSSGCSCAFAAYWSNASLEQPQVSGIEGQMTRPDHLVRTA